MYALNAATGAVLWSYDVGGNPNTFVWSSPAVFGNSVYIGVASFGTCPDVQGQLLQLNRVTGALQGTFDVVPNGCIGGGVWSSPTIDAAAGTIYFTTGNPAGSWRRGESMRHHRNGPGDYRGERFRPEPGGLVDDPRRAADMLWRRRLRRRRRRCSTASSAGSRSPWSGRSTRTASFMRSSGTRSRPDLCGAHDIAIGGDNPTTGSGDIAPAAFDGTTLYVGGDITQQLLRHRERPESVHRRLHLAALLHRRLGARRRDRHFRRRRRRGRRQQHRGLVSAATGASLFTYAGVGPFWGPPSIAGGSLYEGDMSGNLYALTTQLTRHSSYRSIRRRRRPVQAPSPCHT